jgi:hypothetical protein
LNLRLTNIGDAGAAKLSGLTKLRTLNLASTDKRITGAALRGLAALTELEELTLSGTKISDADLDTLARFKKLKRVDLRNTQVTREGAGRLRELLPGAEVKW